MWYCEANTNEKIGRILVMEDNKELVEETENTELTAEEIEDVESIEEEPKEEPQEETTKPIEETFTKEQVDEMIAKKLARKEAKMRREYAQKYSRLETVVNAGLGTNGVDEAVEKLTDFYTQKGVSIPNEPNYSDKDLEILANAEAQDIISGGYDDIVEEVERLASMGTENMTERDKKVFTRLAEERQRIEEEKELSSIGVSTDILKDEDFIKYESKLNPSLSLREKYEMYQATKPKKENNIMGSMKGSPENKIKDYYSPDEISKLTEEDLDNPQIWEAVRRSMTGQN